MMTIYHSPDGGSCYTHRRMNLYLEDGDVTSLCSNVGNGVAIVVNSIQQNILQILNGVQNLHTYNNRSTVCADIQLLGLLAAYKFY